MQFIPFCAQDTASKMTNFGPNSQKSWWSASSSTCVHTHVSTAFLLAKGEVLFWEIQQREGSCSKQESRRKTALSLKPSSIQNTFGIVSPSLRCSRKIYGRKERANVGFHTSGTHLCWLRGDGWSHSWVFSMDLMQQQVSPVWKISNSASLKLKLWHDLPWGTAKFRFSCLWIANWIRNNFDCMR